MAGSGTHHHPVECTGLVREDMVTDMMMIVMEAGMMTDMEGTGTHMEGKGNGAPRMMTDMAEMGAHIVEMVIVMRSAMEEMVTRMMITGEEVKALMITNMGKEVEAQIERENVLLMMMVNILLGMCSSIFYVYRLIGCLVYYSTVS